MSRDKPDIRLALLDGEGSANRPKDLATYETIPRDSFKDLQSYVMETISKRLNTQAVFLNELAGVLQAKSEGMFLWTQLACRNIRPGMTAGQLRQAVNAEQIGLIPLYGRELNRISELAASDRDRAINILRWILFASRPLSVRELAEALALPAHEILADFAMDRIPQHLDQDFVDHQILRLCGSLIEVRRHSSRPWKVTRATVHLSHFSVKEYLINEMDKSSASELRLILNPLQGHEELARACLQYLCFRRFSNTDERWIRGWNRQYRALPRIGGYDFLSYCAKEWVTHVNALRGSMTTVLPQLKKLLLDPEMSGNFSLSAIAREQIETGDPVQHPLYYMALWGIDVGLTLIMNNGFGTGCAESTYTLAVRAAVSRGHDRVVEILMDAADEKNSERMRECALLGRSKATGRPFWRNSCKTVFLVVRALW